MSEAAPTPEHAATAEALVRLMRERGMSAHKLAVALSVSDRTVWRWRSGETTPDQQTVERIAAVLEVDVAEITPAAATQAHMRRLHDQLDELRDQLARMQAVADRQADEARRRRS